MSLKQGTLAFGKRKEREVISLLSDEEEDTAAAARSSSPIAKKLKMIKTSVITESSTSSSSASGPSTSQPLAIKAPPFAISDGFNEEEGRVIRKDPDLDLLYFSPSAFLSTAAMRKTVFEYIRNEFPWYRVCYSKGTFQVNTPRYTCVWGVDETGSPASKYKIQPRPLPAILKSLKEYVEVKTNAKYTHILCNLYFDGKDSISYHSDDETFLGTNPTIASLSLGATRDFCLKHKEVKAVPVEKYALESGTMVVMRGTTQSRWLHAIPKRAKADSRINITFRRAVSVAGTNNYYRYNVGDGPVFRYKDGQMVQTS